MAAEFGREESATMADIPMTRNGGAPYPRPSAGADGVGLRGRTGVDLHALLRDTIRIAIEAGPYSVRQDDAVQQLLRHACDTARSHGTLVEQLLILLKQAWHEMPKARMRRDTDARDTLACVITMCIEEYYGPRYPS